MEYITQVERSSAPAGGAASAASSGAPGSTRPSAARPVFRTQQDGEHRLEGVLERIQCSRDGVVFHVRTADGPELTTAARMEDVAFVTYRSDLSGIISCGPMAGDTRVYVTWRPDPAATSARVAVAIEFLPREQHDRR
jgi:hypothetical protein